jgi:hypothetical protein
VTIPATVPQSSEIPEELMNYPVYTPIDMAQYNRNLILHEHLCENLEHVCS